MSCIPLVAIYIQSEVFIFHMWCQARAGRMIEERIGKARSLSILSDQMKAKRLLWHGCQSYKWKINVSYRITVWPPLAHVADIQNIPLKTSFTLTKRNVLRNITLSPWQFIHQFNIIIFLCDMNVTNHGSIFHEYLPSFIWSNGEEVISPYHKKCDWCLPISCKA